MAPPPANDMCTSSDACTPSWKKPSLNAADLVTLSSRIGFLFSCLTFAAVFLAILTILSHRGTYKNIRAGGLFGSSYGTAPSGGVAKESRGHDERSRARARSSTKVGEGTFLITIGATGVLAFLILCEVSNWFNPRSRRLAFNIVVKVLLFCLIFLIPLLHVHQLLDSVPIARGLKHKRRGKKYFYLIEWGLLAGWLWSFWEVGGWIPEMMRDGKDGVVWRFTAKSFWEECLSRLGLIGISLMAALSGFGVVSAPWHSFGRRHRPVTQADLNEVQAALNATAELWEAKLAQRRYLEAKIKEKKSNQGGGIITKVISVMRTDSDAQELALVQTEINGLETVHSSLSSTVSSLRSRYTSLSGNKYIKLAYITSTLFSLYCIYRIITTAIAHVPWGTNTFFPRVSTAKYPLPSISSIRETDPLNTPSTSSTPPNFYASSKSDPINNILAILARYWDPQLDREGWSRLIGFILSGVIIAGSIRSVVVTVEVLTRRVLAPFISSPPSLATTEYSHEGAHHSHGNQILALGISQITGTYVLASALLLRSNLPPEMSSVITDALGAPALDPRFVDWWFDRIFLWSALATAIGNLIDSAMQQNKRKIENAHTT